MAVLGLVDVVVGRVVAVHSAERDEEKMAMWELLEVMMEMMTQWVVVHMICVWRGLA